MSQPSATLDAGCTMRSPRLWAALSLLLLTASCRLCAATRHGCLFERKICPREQQCKDDGLFGQCRPPQQEPVRYRVSVQDLQRLREVLKGLTVQGLTWWDAVTQEVIGQELSRIPAVSSSSSSSSSPSDNKLLRQSLKQQESPSSWRDGADPEMMLQHLHYKIPQEPSRSSVHVQTPLLDPYSYHQQQQQQRYDFQDEEERSLNSLDDGISPAFPLLGPPSRSRGSTLDQDRQFLEDILSLYLTAPSSSSSSSSSSSTSSSSSLSSPSSFFSDLDFPLDYDDNYVTQVARLKKQQQQQREEDKKKKQEEEEEKKQQQQQKFDTLSALDESSLQQLALLFDHYGLDATTADERPPALKQLQLGDIFTRKPSKGQYGESAAMGRTASEASMVHKTAPVEALPPDPQGGGGRVPTKSDRPAVAVANQSVPEPSTTFRVRPSSKNLMAGTVAEKAVAQKNFLQSETDLNVLQGEDRERTNGKSLPLATPVRPRSSWAFGTLVAMACIGSVLVAAMTVACLRHHAHRLAAKKLGLGPEGGCFSHQEYQDLCRQHMASKGAFGRMEAAALGAVGGAGGGGGGAGVGGGVGGASVGVGAGGASGGGGGGGGGDSRVSSVSSQFSDGAQPSPSSHSSTPSWCEEPAQANMDISTGHMILAYMEDHLRNKNRLMKEWEALCSYQAEPSAVSVAQSDANGKKNRCADSVPYDHSRVRLKAEVNPSRSDYVNASTIIEHDPRMPAYIATQGPLSHTISDFWQMVWENGCTVIVMLTALVEDGEKQCDRYWPDEGSSLYHIYEVNLVSEHIWCNDFLVRSFYLKNVQTQETRTLTQFHFLSWPAQGIPTSTRPLLDFRRKVNKCYRGRSCPIIVHCSDGTGRTGTYILIDMVLNRMAKGVKEIDIAATLEHVRDQRPGMVRTKDQFEFALTAVAEEVNAILKALPQ
ncbi:receptor-type tyrosine-protein phosphatase-like N isoform X2 [Nelusetta ayraudi]|uniref:receptor-type tyrosine-protein phosphatase-like N isoform X2 n=1 Tax=Nelusetta ayraudi TaxID=303726 RepID=UPI003F727971